MKTRTQQIEELNKEWTNPRWEGITRPYSAEEVVKLRGSVNPECTLAQLGAAKMWRLLHGSIVCRGAPCAPTGGCGSPLQIRFRRVQ